MKKYIFAETKKLNKAERTNLAHKTRNPTLLYRLAYDKCNDVVHEVAENPSSTEPILMAIAERVAAGDVPGWNVTSGIINNPNATNTLFEYITEPSVLNSDGWGYIPVSSILAREPSVKVFEQLAQANTESVRAGVAAFPHTPKHVIDELVFDPSSWVRRAVAEREDIGADALEVLIYDPDTEVRTRARNNPNAPTSFVYEGIRELLNSPGTISKSQCKDITTITKNPNIPPELLSDIVREVMDNPQHFETPNVVMQAAIGGENLPLDALEYIFDNIDRIFERGGYDDRTLSGLLHNKNISLDLLNRAARLIRENKDLSDYGSNIVLMSKCGDADYLFQQLKDNRKYWHRVDSDARLIAGNPNAPDEVLQYIIDSESDRYTKVTKNLAKKTLEQRTNPPKPKKASTTGWEVSPYDAPDYASISEEIDQVVDSVMKQLAKQWKCTVDYQFDSNNYDDADNLNITTSTGGKYTVDAQRFLAILTSDLSKKVGATKAVNYVNKVVGVPA